MRRNKGVSKQNIQQELHHTLKRSRAIRRSIRLRHVCFSVMKLVWVLSALACLYVSTRADLIDDLDREIAEDFNDDDEGMPEMKNRESENDHPDKNEPVAKPTRALPLTRRPRPGTAPVKPTTAPPDPLFAELGLLTHNMYRATHDAPALILDSDLSSEALLHAKRMAKEGKLFHGRQGRQPHGENLGLSCSDDGSVVTADVATKDWYNEVCDPGYDFDLSGYQKGTGHFTRVVWKAVTKMGMAYVVSTKQGKTCTWVVARYAPAGDIIGEFSDNVAKGSFDDSSCNSKDTLQDIVSETQQDECKDAASNCADLQSNYNLCTDHVSMAASYCKATCALCTAPPSTPPPPPEDFEQSALDTHNKYRKIHNAPSMQLDNTLIAGANEYAKVLASMNKLIHADLPNTIGENLAYGCRYPTRLMTAEEATKAWYDEVCTENFDFTSPGYSSGTGHFTQVIWKGSLKLGIGRATSIYNGMNCSWIVARYSPRGNMLGQFGENIVKGSFQRSSCSSSSSDMLESGSDISNKNVNVVEENIKDEEAKEVISDEKKAIVEDNHCKDNLNILLCQEFKDDKSLCNDRPLIAKRCRKTCDLCSQDHADESDATPKPSESKTKAETTKEPRTLLITPSSQVHCENAHSLSSLVKPYDASASCSYDNDHLPFQAFGGKTSAWCSCHYPRQKPFLRIDFPHFVSLSSISVAGLHGTDNYVKKFMLSVSFDGETFHPYLEKGNKVLFHGTNNASDFVDHKLYNSISIVALIIHPKQTNGKDVCLRIKLDGCDAKGADSVKPALGLASHQIEDNQLESHQGYEDATFSARFARLNGPRAWCASPNDHPYIEVDFLSPTIVSAISTQGLSTKNYWVQSYEIFYSNDNSFWQRYKENNAAKVFNGNFDRNSIVKHFFDPPVHARHIRVEPLKHHGMLMCLRLEFYGTQEL